MIANSNLRRMSNGHVRCLLCGLLALSFLGCNMPASSDDPDAVTSLHFTPSAFDSFRRNTELKYFLKSPSTLSIYIVKRDSLQHELLVKTLVTSLEETKGSHAVTWLGDTNEHYFAPVGLYFGLVSIGTRRFQTVVQVFHY